MIDKIVIILKIYLFERAGAAEKRGDEREI